MFAQKLVARQNAYRRISREALCSARRLQPRLSGKGDRWDHLVRIILGRFAGETAVPDGGRQATRGGASAASRERKGNSELEKEEHLMKTKMKSKHRSRALLLSILCGGVLATFLGGCAEGPYVATYDTGYYPTAYYTPSYYRTYSYYEPAYDTTIVRSGVRYNDAYGPRYYDRTVYGDW
ncbi:MAG: hypothetical protein DME74_09120 [Verrucomicrobia bacterium]|nr:MAG: hypothetical protein DME74_09120 [Verrucomicrobiota bacterium]